MNTSTVAQQQQQLIAVTARQLATPYQSESPQNCVIQDQVCPDYDVVLTTAHAPQGYLWKVEVYTSSSMWSREMHERVGHLVPLCRISNAATPFYAEDSAWHLTGILRGLTAIVARAERGDGKAAA